MNFLFVDDDEDILDWYMELFGVLMPQINVFTALDAKSALANCSSTHFSLIVSDSKMPGMSGEDLVRHLRSGETKSRDAPVILVSGHGLLNSSGSETFPNVQRIQKPINSEILLRMCCELAKVPNSGG